MRLIGENMVVGIKDAAKHCWADTDFSHISAFCWEPYINMHCSV